LIFVAADEAQLGTARDVIRKAIAWHGIADDEQLQKQLPAARSPMPKRRPRSIKKPHRRQSASPGATSSIR
jgi:hypothetical protein